MYLRLCVASGALEIEDSGRLRCGSGQGWTVGSTARDTRTPDLLHLS